MSNEIKELQILQAYPAGGLLSQVLVYARILVQVGLLTHRGAKKKTDRAHWRVRRAFIRDEGIGEWPTTERHV